MKSRLKVVGAAISLIVLTTPALLSAAAQESPAPAIKVIRGPEDVPDNFCSLARKGDFLVFDGRDYAVLGAAPRSLVTSSNYPYGQAMGSLLGFVPAGKPAAGSDLNIGAPVLRLGDKTHHLGYSKLERIGGLDGNRTMAFEARGTFEDKNGRQAEIVTAYVFDPDKAWVEISSTITNTGKTAIEEVSFSLFMDAYARFSFSPFDDKRFPGLNYRLFQKPGHFLGWMSFNPVEKEGSRYPGRLLPGASAKLRHILLAETSGQKLVTRIYGALGIKPVTASAAFKDFDGPWLEFTAREAFSSAVFYRTILQNPVSLQIPLPPGIYRFQANFFPGSAEELVEVKPGIETASTLRNPPLGVVRVKIRDDSGNPVPGKVSFIGLGATKTPYFRPDNPIETGRSWEGFKNSCFPQGEGLDVELPVGTYLATASRGPEYTIDERAVEIVKEENRGLEFVINRMVDTTGWLALDPHMHTTKSDGSVSVAERIKSAVAEGIEVLVATDHNIVTDYSADLKRSGLDAQLTVLPGCEVTVPDVIHYNTYPMLVRPGEPGNGAINASGDSAGPLFAASREKDPAALLQVNHPRAGDLGFFNNLDLDQKSAATALAELDMGFDVLEVMNGPYYFSSNEIAIQDWYHLLNRGYFFSAVGSSDSHGIDRAEPGYSRTYVADPRSGPAALVGEALVQSIRQGRSFVTNGPMIDLRVNGGFGPGEVCPAQNGRVDIAIRVKSAPWVAVDEVRLVLNGERRIIFPVSAPKREIRKFDQQISLTLEHDTYLCVEALGKETLFPVLQSPARGGSIKGGTLPFALTNPVFVDVDGNRKFDPPLPERIRPVASSDGPSRKVSRL